MRQPGAALLAAQLAENIMPSTVCMLIGTRAAKCHCHVCDCGLLRSLPEVASQIHLCQPGNSLVVAQLVDDIVHIHIERQPAQGMRRSQQSNCDHVATSYASTFSALHAERLQLCRDTVRLRIKRQLHKSGAEKAEQSAAVRNSLVLGHRTLELRRSARENRWCKLGHRNYI